MLRLGISCRPYSCPLTLAEAVQAGKTSMSDHDAITRLQEQLTLEQRARATAEQAQQALHEEVLELKRKLHAELALHGRNTSERITEASNLQDAIVQLDRLRERDQWLQKQSHLVISVLQTLGSLLDLQTAPLAALGAIGDILDTDCIGLLPRGVAGEAPIALVHQAWWQELAQEESVCQYLEGRPMRIITRIDSLPQPSEVLRGWPDGQLDLLASTRVLNAQDRFLLILGAVADGWSSQGLRLLLPRISTLVAEALKRREESRYRKRVETELAQARRMEALGTLASGVAHEMNSPMQYISDNLHFMSDSCTDLTVALDQLAEIGRDAGHGKVVDEILTRNDYSFLRSEIPIAIEQSIAGTRRLSEIIRAIKKFSYTDNSGNEQFDPTEVVNNCLVVSRRVWNNTAEVRVESDQKPKLVKGDPTQLGQALIAMINNACEAIQSKPGWPDPRQRDLIKITVKASATESTITFEDTGPGIPDELRQRIFDPFFTTKGVGKGLGQGLNHCRNIVVKGFGGQIEVDNSPIGGARIRLFLPQAHSDRDPNQGDSEQINTSEDTRP